MRRDVKSNYILAEALAAVSRSANTYNSASVDHSKGSSASFFLSLGNNGTGGTVDAHLEYSDDDSNWNNYPSSDPLGNTAAITQLTTEGTAQLNVVSPRGRYSRCVVTIATDACVVSVTSVLGPNPSISAE